MRIGSPRTLRERDEALACLMQVDPPARGNRPPVSPADVLEGFDLSGLIGAWKNGQLIGVGWIGVAGDGSALVWPPTVRPSATAPDGVCAAILREVVRRLDESRSRYAQCLIEPDRQEFRKPLEANGFRRFADLISLRRSVRRDTPSSLDRGPNGIRFSAAAEERFAAVIERTYLGTLDCPDFVGWRTASEALRSYRNVEIFTPDRWRLIERDGDDVGVILVNDRATEPAREIVYLGIVPEARREGVARSAVTSVLSDACRDGCHDVFAAVDAANEPAVRLYRGLGFRPIFRRTLYMRRSDRRQIDSAR